MLAPNRLLSFVQQFFKLFAHGMKNRLTPAVTALFMLEENPGVGAERVAHLAEMIGKSHQSALALLTSLDGMSEIGPGAPETVQWAQWVGEMAQASDVSVTVIPTGGTVTCDTSLWGGIVRELLTNVRDHGGAAAEVHATVTGGRMRLVVADQGPGLGIMDSSRALEATRRSETSPGVGLGLSKVLFAVVLLDGTVDLLQSAQGVSAIVEADLVSELGTPS